MKEVNDKPKIDLPSGFWNLAEDGYGTQTLFEWLYLWAPEIWRSRLCRLLRYPLDSLPVGLADIKVYNHTLLLHIYAQHGYLVTQCGSRVALWIVECQVMAGVEGNVLSNTLNSCWNLLLGLEASLGDARA